MEDEKITLSENAATQSGDVAVFAAFAAGAVIFALNQSSLLDITAALTEYDATSILAIFTLVAFLNSFTSFGAWLIILDSVLFGAFTGMYFFSVLAPSGWGGETLKNVLPFLIFVPAYFLISDRGFSLAAALGKAFKEQNEQVKKDGQAVLVIFFIATVIFFVLPYIHD